MSPKHPKIHQQQQAINLRNKNVKFGIKKQKSRALIGNKINDWGNVMHFEKEINGTENKLNKELSVKISAL